MEGSAGRIKILVFATVIEVGRCVATRLVLIEQANDWPVFRNLHQLLRDASGAGVSAPKLLVAVLYRQALTRGREPPRPWWIEDGSIAEYGFALSGPGNF